MHWHCHLSVVDIETSDSMLLNETYIMCNNQLFHTPPAFNKLIRDDKDGPSTERDASDDVIHNAHSNDKVSLCQTKFQA